MYYVSVLDGPKRGLLAGPYDTYQEALDMVEPTRKIAQEVDSWAWFYAFGTCKMPEGYDKPGVLNDLLKEAKMKSLKHLTMETLAKMREELDKKRCRTKMGDEWKTLTRDIIKIETELDKRGYFHQDSFFHRILKEEAK